MSNSFHLALPAGDIETAEKLLTWEPKLVLKEGLLETINYLKGIL